MTLKDVLAGRNVEYVKREYSVPVVTTKGKIFKRTKISKEDWVSYGVRDSDTLNFIIVVDRTIPYCREKQKVFINGEQQNIDVHVKDVLIDQIIDAYNEQEQKRHNQLIAENQACFIRQRDMEFARIRQMLQYR